MEAGGTAVQGPEENAVTQPVLPVGPLPPEGTAPGQDDSHSLCMPKHKGKDTFSLPYPVLHTRGTQTVVLHSGPLQIHEDAHHRTESIWRVPSTLIERGSLRKCFLSYASRAQQFPCGTGIRSRSRWNAYHAV